MKITHLTPGTGHFYCGSCLRDHALCLALREMQHDVFLVPLYLPLYLEQDPGHDADAVRLGGINLFLQTKFSPYRWFPRFLKRWLDNSALLRFAARRGNMTDPSKLGPMTLETLRGGAGPQRPEIDELIHWLANHEKPDVIVLSNAMLIGLAAELKQTLKCPLVCTLQGEAPFLDSLSPPYRERCWEELRSGSRWVDRFIAVSQYYGREMKERLSLDDSRLSVVANGIEIKSSKPPRPTSESKPVIGYLARLCRDKGVDTLVDAYIHLRQDPRWQNVHLHLAGVVLDEDQPLVRELKRKLESAGCLTQVSFRPNLEPADKIPFLRELSVFSVPATYGESFGLYLLEAMSQGVPVVQPNHGSFPEIIQATGGGILCPPNDARGLANSLAELLADREKARRLGLAGQQVVLERFQVKHMAKGVLDVLSEVTQTNAV